MWIVAGLAGGGTALATSAEAEDERIEVFEQQLGGNPRPTAHVTFPDWGTDYSEVRLVLEGFNPCELGVEGDEWDRTAYIYIQDERDRVYQIARWLTPYWNLPHVWAADITEMQAVLHGAREVWVEVGGGHLYSLHLDLTFGPPPALPTRVTNLWIGNVGKDFVADFFSPRVADVHETTEYVAVRHNLSTHGGGGPIEFFPAQSGQFVLDGVADPAWARPYNRGDNDMADGFACIDNPTGPQGTCARSQPACAVDDTQANGSCVTGNWGGGRVSWCPGEIVPPWLADVTAGVTPGESVTVDYEHTDVSEAEAGNIVINSQWVEFRRTNHMLVVPLDDHTPRRHLSDNLVGEGTTWWVRNYDDEAIDWVAQTEAPWLEIEPNEGTLEAGETLEVAVRYLVEVEHFGPGVQTATVTFDDTTNDIGESREVELRVEPQGFVAYWPMDDVDGVSLVDHSGNEHHGAFLGDDEPEFVDGRFGQALALDAGADRVELPRAAIDGRRELSVSLWFQTESTTEQMLMAGGTEDRPNDFRLFLAGEGQQVRATIAGRTATWADFDFADGEWHHLVLVYDPADDWARIWLDGDKQNKADLLAIGASAVEVGRLLLGERLDADGEVVADNGFEGAIDDLRVYTYRLFRADVDAIAQGGPAMMPFPHDDARGVELDTGLSWVPGAAAVSHELYFGLSRDEVEEAEPGAPEHQGEVEDSAFDPDTLELDTKYFWRVDTRLEDGSILRGDVWKLRTEAPEPPAGTDGGESSEGGGDSTTGSPTPPSSEAGSDEATDDGAGAASDDDDGCSCTTSRQRSRQAWWLWLAAPLLIRRRHFVARTLSTHR